MTTLLYVVGAALIFAATVAIAMWFMGRHPPDTRENRWDAGHTEGSAGDFGGGGGCGGGG